MVGKKWIFVVVLLGLLAGLYFVYKNRGKRASGLVPPDIASVDSNGAANIHMPAIVPACNEEVLGQRRLNKADKQFIDWKIPSDAEIVFIQEDDPQTRDYAAEVLNYIRTKLPFSVKHQILHKIISEKDRKERLYIDFTGDHNYVIYIFNQYQQ